MDLFCWPPDVTFIGVNVHFNRNSSLNIFNRRDVNTCVCQWLLVRALFLGTIMAVVDLAPQSLHVKTRAASHAVSSAPRCDWPRVPLARWLVSSAHLSSTAAGQWVWTDELMQTQQHRRLNTNTASMKRAGMLGHLQGYITVLRDKININKNCREINAFYLIDLYYVS